MTNPLDSLVLKGEQALNSGDTLVAMMQFEAAHALDPRPTIKAKLAFCLAKERKQYNKAIILCREALLAEPNNPDHYYQLSRIFLIAGQKNQAIKTLRKGLKFQRYQPIINELNQLGVRRDPIFSFLPRNHFLNRYLGLLFSKLGSE